MGIVPGGLRFAGIKHLLFAMRKANGTLARLRLTRPSGAERATESRGVLPESRGLFLSARAAFHGDPPEGL